MKLWKRIEQLWTRKEKDGEGFYSIVILLHEAHFFNRAEIQAAGEKGWGINFDGQTNPMYFVVQNGNVTMIKAGTQVVNVNQANQPYLGEPQDIANQLPREEQKRAWLAHTAWVSVDLLNGLVESDMPKAEAYVTLAKFALHLGDANCSAVYLPKENILLPNDGTAEEGLRRLVRKEPIR